MNDAKVLPPGKSYDKKLSTDVKYLKCKMTYWILNKIVKLPFVRGGDKKINIYK